MWVKDRVDCDFAEKIKSWKELDFVSNTEDEEKAVIKIIKQ